MRTLLVILVFVLAGCNTHSGNDPSPSSSGYGGRSTTTVNEDGTVTTEITPPTPAEEALAVWVKWGAALAVVGVLMCLPVFGSNARSGLFTVLGGAGMAAVGHFFGSIKIEIPAWVIPSLVVLVVAGMLYGWSVRNKQKKTGEDALWEKQE